MARASRLSFGPHPQAILDQKTLVVPKQFIRQAGTGDVSQFHLGLAGGGGGATGLADGPHPAARGLGHLVGQTAVVSQEPAAEHNRCVINHLGDFIAAQAAVATVG